MAGEAGVVDRLVVAVDYDYDQRGADVIEADFSGLLALAAAVAAALTALTVSTAAEVSQMERLGMALNLGTQGAFEMAHAFKAIGADVNDISDTLLTVSDYALEAAAGNQEWRKTFTAAGVAVDDLRDKDPAGILDVVADGIAGLTDPAQRAAAASRIFGDDVGRKLLPVLIKGAAGFRALREEQQLYSGVITEEDARAATALTISLRRLSAIPAGLGRRIGIGLAPSLERAVTGMNDWYLANADVIGQQVDRTVDGLARSLDELQTPTGKAIAAAGSLAAAWGAVGVARSMYTAAAAASPLVAALGGQAGAALAAAKSGGPLVLAAIGVTAALDDLTMAAEGNDSILLRLGESMGAKGETQRSAAGLIDLLDAGAEAAWAFGGALSAGIGDAIDELAEKIPSLEPLLKPIRELLDVDVSAKGVIGGIADQLERSAEGLRQGTRYLQGDSSVAFAPGRGWGDVLAGNEGRYLLQPEGLERDLVRAGQSLLARVSVPLSLTVQSGPSKEEIARIAGEQARAEVERQTLEALLAAEQSP